MNVSSQAPVISEIVSGVIGILVDGDGITAPVPIRHVRPVNGRNLKVITVEPESLAVAALKMEYVTGSEPEPELTMGEWVVDVRNVLMTDPLFPLYVRPGSYRASVRGSAVFLRPAALRFASASLWFLPLWRSAVGLWFLPLGRSAVGLWLCLLWRSAAGLRSRLRCAARRTMLRKVLPSTLIDLPSVLLRPFRFTASFLRIQALTHVSKQTD